MRALSNSQENTHTDPELSFLTDADLNIAQTAWGDSGVYVCSVVSSQDLTGTNEDYTELIVLGKLCVLWFLKKKNQKSGFCHPGLFSSFSHDFF